MITPPTTRSQSIYQVTVRASDGHNISDLPVTINITNVDEPGVVTLSSGFAPGRHTRYNASLTDPDRCRIKRNLELAVALTDKTSWVHSLGVESGSGYTPVDADEDNYLQATASYDDNQGTGKNCYW